MTIAEHHDPLTRRQKDAVALLAVTALVVVFFWRFLFLGEIPLNGDWLLKNFEPWRSAYRHLKVQNAELDDPIMVHYPLWLAARQMMRAGVPPIWNPYILCGTPLLADSMSHPFDPLNLLTLPLSDELAWGYVLFFSFLIAGITFFLYLREIGIGRLGAFVGAACYVLNGFFVVWAEYRFVVGLFCWLPITLIALERVLAGRSMIFALVGGIALGFGVLAGNLHFVFISGLLFGAYAVWRIRNAAYTWGAPTALRGLKGAGIMLAIGAGLSAIQWLPTLEFIPLSQRSVEKYAGINYLHSLELIALVAPKFFGHPANGNFIGSSLFPRSYVTMNAPYVGVFGLMLAFVGLMSWRRRLWVRFYGAAALGVIVFLLLMNASATHYVLGHVVHIDTVDHHRMLVLTAIGFAVLAGFGMDELVSARKGLTGKKGLSPFFFLRIAAGAALGLVIVMVVTSFVMLAWKAHAAQIVRQPTLAGYLFFLFRKYGSPMLAPHVIVSMIFLGVSAFVGRVWSNRGAKGSGSFCRNGPSGASHKRCLTPLPGRVLPYVCLAILVVDLLYFGLQYNPFVPPSLIYPETAVSELLRPSLGLARISGIDTPGINPWKGDCFPPSSALPYGLTDLRGKEGFYSQRTRKFMAVIKRDPDVIFEASVHFNLWKSKLLNLLGMRYVISRDEITDPSLKCVYNGRVRVYENPAALPRAFIVHKAYVIGAEMSLFRIFFHEAFEPAQEVLLEEEPYGFPLETEAKPGSAARIVEYSPTQVVVDVEMKSPGFLVLTDSYLPGWQATVDGERSRLLTANFLLRCVPVREGAHRVEFRYQPPSFIFGAGLTVLTLLSLPILVFYIRRRH